MLLKRRLLVPSRPPGALFGRPFPVSSMGYVKLPNDLSDRLEVALSVADPEALRRLALWAAFQTPVVDPWRQLLYTVQDVLEGLADWQAVKDQRSDLSMAAAGATVIGLNRSIPSAIVAMAAFLAAHPDLGVAVRKSVDLAHWWHMLKSDPEPFRLTLRAWLDALTHIN